MKIDALLWLAHYPFLCPICDEPIRSGDPIDWDHGHAWALGGEHSYSNIRPLHRACHRTKTSGTKATSAGSDIHKIAKVKRLVRKAAGTWKKTKRAWPSRPFPQRKKS